jgi:hypothetical protein
MFPTSLFIRVPKAQVLAMTICSSREQHGRTR